MRLPSSRFLPLSVLLLALTLLGMPLHAQRDDQREEPQIDESFIESEPSPEIDAFMEDDLAVLAGEGTSYEPGDRRDPFISLVEPTEIRPDGVQRPPGIPGLSIDDVEVTGIFVTGEGAVAQIRVANKPQSFLLREGDQLWDGDVRAIAFDEVVFKQNWDDGLKPFRDVVKKLRPQGGEGS